MRNGLQAVHVKRFYEALDALKTVEEVDTTRETLAKEPWYANARIPPRPSD